jgi:hypothetical protein
MVPMSEPEGTTATTDPVRDGQGAGAEAHADDPGHPTGEALERAVAHLRAIGRDILHLLDLSLERARLGIHTGSFRLLLAGWLAVVGAAATVLAAYFVLEGTAGGLAQLLGGQDWAGRLLAGLLVMLLLAATLSLYRRRSRRANLKRLKKKYARRRDAARPGRGDFP